MSYISALDEFEQFWGPQEPLTVRRTLHRQRLDFDALYNTTIDRGRPNQTVFRQCPRPKCTECGYKDHTFVAEVWPEDDDEQCTLFRHRLLFDALIAHFWGSVPEDEREKAEKRKCIESFVYSPPVKGSFAQFSMIIEHNDRGMKGDTERIAKALTEHRETLITYLTSLRNGKLRKQKGHWRFFNHSHTFDHYPLSWTIEKFMLQFFLASESWRLFSVKKQGAKMWDFPGADDVGKMVDFLSAVLLNYTDMRNRRSVKLRAYNMYMHNEDWAEWDDEYQVFTEELKRRSDAKWTKVKLASQASEKGEALTKEEIDAIEAAVRGTASGDDGRDGEECLGGYGKGADELEWMTKRIKVSTGHIVLGYKP